MTPCIVCDKEIAPAFPDAVTNQPYGATSFVSHGQYGSTVFDPMDTSFLQVNICDSCLRSSAKYGQVLLYTPHPQDSVQPVGKAWDPDETQNNRTSNT